MIRGKNIGTLKGWLARWGFAALVMVAAAAGLAVGATVPIPPDLPSVALRATALYRLEVGAATFVGLYVAAMALVLAFQNRAFTEFGTGGVKATNLASKSLTAERTSREAMRGALEWVRRRREEEEGG